MNTATLVSAAMLSAVLPVSVATLYVLVRRHTSLGADSPMDASVVARFDNADELNAFHADHLAAAQRRTGRILARYRQALLAQVARLAPGQAAAFRARLMGRPSDDRQPSPSADALLLMRVPGHAQSASTLPVPAEPARRNGARVGGLAAKLDGPRTNA